LIFECSPIETDCSGECKNLQTDVSNCGTCGNACSSGQICCSGQCVNPTALTTCGICSNNCASQGFDLCCNGQCRSTTGLTSCGVCSNNCLSQGANLCCNGVCKIASALTSCGSCSNDCTSLGLCCGTTCADINSPQTCGSCTNQCTPGKSCCSGQCFDLQTDSLNCGACGSPCSSGQICCNGQCVSPTALTSCGSCSNNCVSQGLNLCCSGQCKSSTGVSSCGSCANDCTALGLCCSGTCANIKNEQTCGSCNNQCPSGQICNPNTLNCYDPSSNFCGDVTFPTSVNEGSLATFTFNINPLYIQTSERFTISLTAQLNGQTVTNSASFAGGSSSRLLSVRLGGPGTASITATISSSICSYTQTGTLPVIDVPPKILISSISSIKAGQNYTGKGSVQEVGYWTRPQVSLNIGLTTVQCTVTASSTISTNTQYSFTCPAIQINTAGSIGVVAVAQTYWNSQALLSASTGFTLTVTGSSTGNPPPGVPLPIF